MNLLKTISNFFKTQAYGNNTIIMFAGSENTVLTAYSTKGFSRTTHIPNTDPEFFGKYRSFLNQFKGWDVVLLIDNENIKIKKGELPLVQSVFKMQDNAKQFVVSAVDDEEIIAYRKSNMETESGARVETVTFAHTKASAHVLDIISFIYNFNFPLVGIYMLTMEIKDILQAMNENVALSMKDKFIIFVIPTLVSGIRLFAIDRGVIYSSKSVPYPHGKSSEYLAGLIEQSVSDALLKYKKHIASHELSVEIVSLTSSGCAKVIAKHEIDVAWHSLAWDNTKQKLAFSDFGDEVLVHNLRLKYPAANKPLRQIYAMERFNNRVLNAAMAVIVAVGLYAGSMEYQILRTESNVAKLNEEYYKLSESYREARKKLQDINNLPEIYDIISDIAILKASTPQPVQIAKHIVDIKDQRVHIAQILWKLTKENVGIMESELVMNIRYEDKSVNELELQKHLDEYQVSLTRIFPDYRIEFVEDQKNIVNLQNKIIIPAKFTIKGPVDLVE